MSKLVNASGLCKYTLIRACWKRAPIASAVIMSGTKIPDAPTNSDINQQTYPNGYINYLNGRHIKTNFSNMSAIDPCEFDRHVDFYYSNKSGTLKSIVDILRRTNC